MDFRRIIEQHHAALQEELFRGYDPYDGLKSRLFRMTPFFRSGKLRLAWIQIFKRSPVNFRPLALVPKGSNAKGLALIIRGLVNMHRIYDDRRYLDEAVGLAGKLIAQRAPDREYFCAGYDFFWEARAFSVPEFTPNMVVSTFAGHALLDLHEAIPDTEWLGCALGAGEFMEKELLLRETDDQAVFGYVPGERKVIHNVNLLAAAYFARLYSISKDPRHEKYASKAAGYSVKAQREDGAWTYGEEDYQGWIDNFHTGFNLVSLEAVRRHLDTDVYDESMELGLAFHMDNHYLKDMTPKYYDGSLYPVDIHNFAQGIDTFLTFGYMEKARNLAEKAVEMMWDEKKHYFYYRKNKWYKNRIDYLRWSQAWMFYALTRFALSAGCGYGRG